ncbi:MAG: hypothetical protein L6R37_004743 [Teloschistes peruensis]|nr:MAG: hypothetical protein L6R37_004743 [Teloschistes peruensis]
MAPKKKNRKAINNPARGFATTSVASKTKPLIENAVETGETSPSIDESELVQEKDGSSIPLEKELHELSPEELEKQLEESDLQLLLERHSEKVRRDVARQINKCQTEKRLLRAQAEPLQTRSWLPPEIMDMIMQTVETELSPGFETRISRKIVANKELSDDDLCIKIWTLKQILVQIGFPLGFCQDSLKKLLICAQNPAIHEFLTERDDIWGLDWCLDWLALHCEDQEAPSYLPTRRQPVGTPILGQLQLKELGSGKSDDAAAARRSNQSFATPRYNANGSPQGGEDTPIQIDSDSESDVDPETMTEKYVALQTQLYGLQPNLNISEHQTIVNSQTQSRSNAGEDVRSQVARLERKLEHLKADILFDKSDAEHHWAGTRNQLAKAAAERRRLHLDENTGSGTSSPRRHENAVAATVQDGQSSDGSNDDDAAEALGDFFSGLPDGPSDSPSAMSVANSTAKVRDFGRWTGVSPRRTLEEACKSRDSHVRITYQLLDRSPFSKQHSIIIRWSCDQPDPLASPTEAISCVADRRCAKIEMRNEATPDAAQSEAYISTVVLFLMFSSTPKEEKTSLRLPAVWRGFWSELSTLKKRKDTAVDCEELREIRALIDDTRKQTPNDPSEAHTAYLTSNELRPHRNLREQEAESSLLLGDSLQALWWSKSTTPPFRNMLAQRAKLPIHNFRNEIPQTIDENQIVIVCGETGCGKSTQVPSFILEQELLSGRACRIYCTEPRRISAISLARRVSEELGEKKSDVGTSRSLVGYAIRLESKMTKETRLVFATTGIVMRMLESSDDFGEITHLVLDEIHERSIESDFLLIVLRKLLARRPTLKVVLMSATVDAVKFSSYFGGAPVLTVPGRTFPVETKFLEDALEETNFSNDDFSLDVPLIDDDDEAAEDSSGKRAGPDPQHALKGYNAKTRSTLAKFDEYRVNYSLIQSLLAVIATSPKYTAFSKAILVFLPGIAEIRRLNSMLAVHNTFSSGWLIHSLHSTIAMEEQEKAFAIPPPGYRKIVLSTNIAETGVTIPDVTCVVDTGKHKEMRFDEKRQLSRLIEVFISRANAKQRRGRAGRVREGICFHLFTKARHDTMMAPEQTPEILRLSLQDLVLRVKICKLGNIDQTLSEALDPPSAKNIRRAIDALIDVKALTVSEELTPLGRQLAKLPLDVFLGKLLLLGCVFRCLDAALTIAAIMSSKSPFAAPMGARSQADQARLAFKKGDSDLLTIFNAYAAWRRVCTSNATSEQQFCRKNFLSAQNLSNIEELKAQLATSLLDAGFLKLDEGERLSIHKVRSWSSKRTFIEIPARYDTNSSELILNSVVAWSFYPKLLKRDGKGWRNVANNQPVSLHVTSVNKGVPNPPRWLSFYHIMQSGNKSYNAHETSAVEPFAFILACGDADFKASLPRQLNHNMSCADQVRVQMYSGVIVVDGNRMRFSVDDWKLMLVIKILRQSLRQIMAQSFRDPGYLLSPQQQIWLDIWTKIFGYHAGKAASGKP